MTPLSIQDQIQKFRSIDKSRQKQKPHQYMEMSEEGNEELQRMVTSPWTFSSSNINACKYAFNLRWNILFFSSNNNMDTRRTT
jgi:DNA-binding PadR family transcriptional regulator